MEELDRFTPIPYEEGMPRWHKETSSTMDSLAQVSVRIGREISEKRLVKPTYVEVPAGAIVKRGSQIPIIPVYEVKVPFVAQVERVRATFTIASTADDGVHKVLIPNHHLATRR